MNQEVLYRVRVANAKDMRKEVAMMLLRRGFSLKKVLIVEGGAFLLSLLQYMLAWAYGEQEGTLIYLFALPLFVLGFHLWFVLGHMLGVILRMPKEKNTEWDREMQFCFFPEYYQQKDGLITYEWGYDDIERVRETRSSFLLESRRYVIVVILKKNFLEGDLSSFQEFLNRMRQRTNSSIVGPDTEEGQERREIMWQAGAVLNEEVCIRNGILEQSWTDENMSYFAHFALYLDVFLILLPIFALVAGAYLASEESRGNTMFIVLPIFIATLLGAFAVSAVRGCKKRGINYSSYQNIAIKTYQLMAKKGMLTHPMSYRFYEDCFEMTQGSVRQICQYAAVRRMYQTQWYLVLMVGTDTNAKAFSIEKRSSGEECQRLMDFLRERTGQEWKNSPV